MLTRPLHPRAACRRPLARVAQSAVRVSSPPANPSEIAALEPRVLANPGQLELRASLLRLYLAASPSQRGGYRAARLTQIRFLISAAPASPLATSPIAWVGSADGPYASPDDHAVLVAFWNAEAASHFEDPNIILNAARFLGIENKPEAEQLFLNAVAAKPADVDIAARLGFFYAAGLVGADTMDGRVLTTTDHQAWVDHCRAALDQSSNLHVLMGAATALPNLAMRRTGGGTQYESWTRYSEELRARADVTAPGGPSGRAMPPEFGMFPAESEFERGQPVEPGIANINGGPNPDAAALISSQPPAYPPLALKAGVQGVVKLLVTVGPRGEAEKLRLISGPPLLVEAAMQAVQTWTWRPAMLNGTPGPVTITVEVPFALTSPR